MEVSMLSRLMVRMHGETLVVEIGMSGLLNQLAADYVWLPCCPMTAAL